MKQPEAPWALILILLVGVSSAAWLIMVEGWSFEGAYLLVAMVTGLLSALVLGFVFWLSSPAEWKEVKIAFTKAIKSDFRGLLRSLWKQWRQ